MPTEKADLDWYIERSTKLRLKPRCPIAHAELCPRYYTSLWLLASDGVVTPISEDTKSRLDKKWQQFQPTIREEEASISKYNGCRLSAISSFCPEVSFEVFGQFVSSLFEFVDDIDRKAAHNMLAREKADRTDPRWRWQNYSRKHYSECREYSLFCDLAGQGISSSKGKGSRSRTGLPQSVRWQVFARDSFVCQYCGRRPPEVVLEVDHRTSVANGGNDTLENLATACADCNRGKGSQNG